MKKTIAIILVTFVLVGIFAACIKQNKQNDINDDLSSTLAENTKKMNIVTTIFPEYDWVREILGEKAGNAEITMLLDNGVDLHSYQPTADDMIKISECDLFIHVGGASDKWVDDALENASNKEMKVINLMETLGDSAKNSEMVEGMQEAEHEHEHEDEEEHEEEHEHEEEEEHEHEEEHEGEEHEHEHNHKDEHVWLSLRNAKLFCSVISSTIQEIDSENKDIYAANTASYIEKLTTLDVKYREAVSNANRRTLLFGDRFPFRYMTDDYSLEYFAAFTGCSAESEASFETISFLAKKVDELNLTCVMTVEGSNSKIAPTIIQNTENKNQKILAMNSMGATTSVDVKNGTTYLSVMEKNLAVLKEALS